MKRYPQAKENVRVARRPSDGEMPQAIVEEADRLNAEPATAAACSWALRHGARRQGARRSGDRGGGRAHLCYHRRARSQGVSAKPDEGTGRALTRFRGQIQALSGRGLERRLRTCAGSSDTSALVSARRSCSRASSAWNTGVRLRRARLPRGRRARLRAGSREPREPEEPRRDERLERDDRPRPHALGDPRRGHRGERAPAGRVRSGQPFDRPERDRRELPRAQGESRRRRPHLHLRDRRRDRRPPRRAPLRGRPRRGCPSGVRELEGHFAFVVIHRDHPGLLVGAGTRCRSWSGRRGRELPRLERGGLPPGDAHGAIPGRR